MCRPGVDDGPIFVAGIGDRRSAVVSGRLGVVATAGGYEEHLGLFRCLQEYIHQFEILANLQPIDIDVSSIQICIVIT
jgi:hypothetical protein